MKKKLKKDIETTKSNNVSNDKSIPEKDRIYSTYKEYWCKKTTKASANQLFKNKEQMKKDIERRGTDLVVPPKDDWYIKRAGLLPLKNNQNIRISYYYIFDETKGLYRKYIDNTRYGDRKEIIFEKKNQCFTIMDLDKLREKWNDTHKDKVKRDIDRIFKEFIKKKF